MATCTECKMKIEEQVFVERRGSDGQEESFCGRCYMHRWQDRMQNCLSGFVDGFRSGDNKEMAINLLLIEMGIDAFKRTIAPHYFGDIIALP